MIETGFWSPTQPPSATYAIECSADFENGTIAGTNTISFTNDSGKTIFKTALLAKKTTRVDNLRFNGKKTDGTIQSGECGNFNLYIIKLPIPLMQKETAKFEMEFSSTSQVPGEFIGWYPKLWWTFPTHDNYEVKIHTGEEFSLVTSGTHVNISNNIKAVGTSSFAVFETTRFESCETKSGNVKINTFAKTQELADQTAKDAEQIVSFYRSQFWFYPTQHLNILCSAVEPENSRMTATVKVSSAPQGRQKQLLELALQVARQYWGCCALASHAEASLFEGLASYIALEFLKQHSDCKDSFADIWQNHCQMLADCSGELSSESSAIMVHALAAVCGKKNFDKVYRNTLKQSTGKKLALYTLQKNCEQETNMDLDWFFRQWKTQCLLDYRIKQTRNEATDAGNKTTVLISPAPDSLLLPMPVKVVFEDGSEQTAWASQFLSEQSLEFESKSPAKSTLIDPEKMYPFMHPNA